MARLCLKNKNKERRKKERFHLAHSRARVQPRSPIFGARRDFGLHLCPEPPLLLQVQVCICTFPFSVVICPILLPRPGLAALSVSLSCRLGIHPGRCKETQKSPQVSNWGGPLPHTRLGAWGLGEQMHHSWPLVVEALLTPQGLQPCPAHGSGHPGLLGTLRALER